MKLKIKKPTTPSQRHLIQLNTEHLKKKPTIKKQLKGLKNSGGRNNSGKITIHHKGGGHKKKYRLINFYRKKNSTGITIGLEYDPNRNTCIAAIYDLSKKEFFYILAPKNLKVGDIIKSGKQAKLKVGHSLPISEIPIGSYIHNISSTADKYAKISRSAGTFSIIKEKTLEYAKIELSSGKQKLISPKCYATMGIVSNELIILTQKGKAGRTRWLNQRPSVRGVAMNPVDHPHGGGEGKKSGKGKTPWGKTTKKGFVNIKKSNE
nr:ribosomal protein L2 [Schizostauron trachyderma]